MIEIITNEQIEEMTPEEVEKTLNGTQDTIKLLIQKCEGIGAAAEEIENATNAPSVWFNTAAGERDQLAAELQDLEALEDLYLTYYQQTQKTGKMVFNRYMGDNPFSQVIDYQETPGPGDYGGVYIEKQAIDTGGVGLTYIYFIPQSGQAYQLNHFKNRFNTEKEAEDYIIKVNEYIRNGGAVNGRQLKPIK